MSADAEARFRAAFDHAPVGMAIVTRDTHRVVRANCAASSLLGVGPGQLAGRFMAEFKDATLRSTHGGVDEDAGFSGERACRRDDGRKLWLEVHSAVLPESSASGEPLCLLHLIDITPRKAAEAERDRQQAWVSALGEVRLAVLLGSSTHRALALVCRQARALLSASDAVVVVPSSDAQVGVVEAADGTDAEELVHRSLPLADGLAATVLATGRVVVTGGATQPRAVLDGLLPAGGRGAVVGLPLRTPDVVLGVLCVVRSAGEPFTRADVEIARSFAEQAAAALHIGALRADRERLRVLEDRERIARDLHDSVIQDLFAAGMSLDAVAPLIQNARAAERVATTIDQLDSTIKKIRSTIFELETTDPAARASDVLRAALDSRRDQLGFGAKLELEGDVDDLPGSVVDHLVAVVSEALSNVARHARATFVTVRVAVCPGDGFELTVRDDGAGFDRQQVRCGNGLANIQRRATLLGGRLTVQSVVGGGTVLSLTCPAVGASAAGSVRPVSQVPHSPATPVS